MLELGAGHRLNFKYCPSTVAEVIAFREHGTESATFSYAAEYLARRDAYELDPMLHLSAGQQQTPAGRPIFGAFSDCAPDRWGRRLINRAEQHRVRHEPTAENAASAADSGAAARRKLAGRRTAEGPCAR